MRPCTSFTEKIITSVKAFSVGVLVVVVGSLLVEQAESSAQARAKKAENIGLV